MHIINDDSSTNYAIRFSENDHFIHHFIQKKIVMIAALWWLMLKNVHSSFQKALQIQRLKMKKKILLTSTDAETWGSMRVYGQARTWLRRAVCGLVWAFHTSCGYQPRISFAVYNAIRFILHSILFKTCIMIYCSWRFLKSDTHHFMHNNNDDWLTNRSKGFLKGDHFTHHLMHYINYNLQLCMYLVSSEITLLHTISCITWIITLTSVLCCVVLIFVVYENISLIACNLTISDWVLKLNMLIGACKLCQIKI